MRNSNDVGIERFKLLKRNSAVRAELVDLTCLIEDKNECLVATNIDPSISEHELSDLLKRLDLHQIEGREIQLPMDPRAVFFISIGANKLQKLKFISNKESQTSDIQSRLKSGSTKQRFLEEIEEKKFADSQQAEEFARRYIADFDINNDKDFCLVDIENARVMSCVSDALSSIVQLAKEHSAALVIPDYNSGSPGSRLIEAAILHADFRGPVINVGNDSWTAVRQQQVQETFTFRSQSKPKSFLLQRATHSFQVRGSRDRMDYSRLAARLTRAIAGRPPASSPRPPPRCPGRAAPLVACVVACGGKSVVEHVAALAQHALPVVVLEGSGRLCDFLPAVYPR